MAAAHDAELKALVSAACSAQGISLVRLVLEAVSTCASTRLDITSNGIFLKLYKSKDALSRDDLHAARRPPTRSSALLATSPSAAHPSPWTSRQRSSSGSSSWNDVREEASTYERKSYTSSSSSSSSSYGSSASSYESTTRSSDTTDGSTADSDGDSWMNEGFGSSSGRGSRRSSGRRRRSARTSRQSREVACGS